MRILPAIALAVAFCAAGAQKDTVIVIPHTHWEGAVFKTRAEYLDIGLPHILKALHLLKKYPGYRFVLDQMCYVRPFIERYPHEAATFRRFLDEGRLQIAGGTDSMHDSNVVSGESIARQYLLAKTWFRERLGYEVKTGWGLDTFGHNAQTPQILKLAGMESYWFQRGVPGPDTPAEFLWQGIDGTQVPAFWLPISYGALAHIPHALPDFERMIRSRFDALSPFARGHGRVLMAGADVWEPEDHLPDMLEQFNRSGSAPFVARFGLATDYEALVAKRAVERQVISGELNPVFQGGYSSRIEVKQWNRELERLLTSAEKAAVLSGRRDGGDIEKAWEPVLFNQAHDVASGVMVDKVFEDTLASYRYSQRLGAESLEAGLGAAAGRIDTQGTGVPIVVFNLLGWPRTDFVEADVAFTEPGIQDMHLVDDAGKSVAFAVMRAERNGDGGIRLARIGFVARAVPSMGHVVYRAVPGAAPSPAPAVTAKSSNTRFEDSGHIENEFYRAAFNLWTGEMTSLVLKENNWEALKGSGNVVAGEEDGGDFWELYGTLNGARFTAMKKPIGLPRSGATIHSSDFVGGSGNTVNGAVLSEFRISHPFGKNHFATTVRMYAGVRRIDIRTEITNQQPGVRYRVLFPTTIENGTNMQEIPFGAIERPRSQELPAQHWIDWSGGGRGLGVLNRGLPGSNVAGSTMMLSLARSARLISYGYIGGYEPGVSSDSGLELGKKLSFDYALVPHAGTWREAALWRAGLEFNNPLIAVAAAPHPGRLPKRWGMIEASTERMVVSVLKPGRDGTTVVRVYEPSGERLQGARIRLSGLRAAAESNLIEDAGREIPVTGEAFTFDLKPFEIKTFRCRLQTP